MQVENAYLMNLDGLDRDDLLQYARDTAEMFGATGETVYSLLSSYATIKAESMKVRSEGSIDYALFCDSLCDSIYQMLPPEVIW